MTAVTATPAGPVLAGPFGTRTEPFLLVNRHGAAIRGVLHRVPADGPVVVVVPGLGVRRRGTLLPALHLLANGFHVVRFDLTNSVGLSDGQIVDFALGGVCDDLSDVVLWARETFRTAAVSALAASITGRAVLRTAARHPGLLRLVTTVGCVVDVQATLTAIQGGLDVVARWRDGTLTDLGEVGNLLGHDVRLRGLVGLVADDLTGLGSTVRDLRAASATRFVNFHGALDPWVRTGQVHTAFGAFPHTTAVVVDDAGHDFHLAAMRGVVTRLVGEYRAMTGSTGTGPVRAPTADDLFAQGRIEQAMDEWWAARLDAPVRTGQRAC